MNRAEGADPATSSWKVWTPLMEAELIESSGEDGYVNSQPSH